MNPYAAAEQYAQEVARRYSNQAAQGAPITTPTPQGSFWQGSDGNVWVAGDNGTNSAGSWDDNSQNYWSTRGYSYINDPVSKNQNDSGTQSVLGYSTGSGGLTGGLTSPTYDARDMYLIDQQIDNVNSGIGRLDKQRDIGRGNIDKTYGQAQSDRQSQFNAAQGQYDLTKERTGQDYTNTRASIRAGAGQQNSALQRLLGSAGAGRSSAAQILAPFAVGRQAAQRFGEVQDTFGRNQQDLDAGWQSTVSANEAADKKLRDERTNQYNALDSGLAQTRVGFLDQLAGLQLQKQNLLGGSVDSLRSSLSPYQTKIQDLLSQIDGYGKLAVTSRPTVGFTAPELEAYNYSRFDTPTLNGQRNPVADYVSPIGQLLQRDEEKLRVQ